MIYQLQKGKKVIKYNKQLTAFSILLSDMLNGGEWYEK
jgi:hypothetical protein